MLNFGAGRKRHLQVSDGGVLQSSGQSQKTLTCTVITTGLDWSPQCHTAWDAGAGRSWWCLGQFYAGLLPVLCCSLLINWCPGTGAARWGHASEDSSAAQHLARTSGRTPTPGDNHVKASQIQLTISSQARVPQIRANSYLSSVRDKRMFKKPQKTREGN